MKYLILIFIFALSPGVVFASPSLNFSDITQGPKTGLNDGYGDGAIVTIWGNRLGDTQGSSTISVCGTTPAHIYYWKDADGTLPGGPANLYEYHQMQEIAFSIPSSCTDGQTTIAVTVDGETSNTLPFTIRAGSIYHVKATGDNSADGSFSNPWESVSEANNGAVAQMATGDIVYVHDGVQDVNTDTTTDKVAGVLLKGLSGSASAMSALVAYPNASILARGTNYGFRAYQYLTNVATHIVISKWSIEGGNDDVSNSSYGLETNPYGRIVANNITAITSTSVQGQQGAICGNAYGGADNVSGVKIYGNEVHDWGEDNTAKLEHTTYLTNRSGDTAVAAWEWGWNYLHDNGAKSGIHNYDENIGGGDCGGVTGTVKIHDNVVMNQRNEGIDWIGATTNDTYTCFTNNVEIYNNLLINTGIGPDGIDPTSGSTGYYALPMGIRVGGYGMQGNVKIYNNTIVGAGNSYNADETTVGAIRVDDTVTIGTVEIRNNIIVNDLDLPFIEGADNTQVTIDNNLYYYSSGTATYAIVPSEDTSAVNSDPLLSNSYIPQTGSMAIATGLDLSSVLSTDILQFERSDPWAIGAFSKEAIAASYNFGWIKGN